METDRKPRGLKDVIIDGLEGAKEIHATARACMIVTFLSATAMANTMKPEDSAKAIGPVMVWMFFNATVDTITTPGALRDIEKK